MIYQIFCIALFACSIVNAAPANGDFNNYSDDSKSGQSKAILTFDDQEESSVNENLEDLPGRGPNNSDNDNQQQGFPSFPDYNGETTTKSHEQDFNQAGGDYTQGGNQGGQEEFNQSGNQDHNQGHSQETSHVTNAPSYGGYDNNNQQSGNSDDEKPLGGIFGVWNKVSEAAKETFQENKEKIKEHVQSVVEAGRGVLEAGKQTLQTGIKLGTTLPRIGAKVIDKVANDDKSKQDGNQLDFNFF